ncbi:MAG: Calx-beta domain-containing protein, partial [Chitinophagaceae bacterium]
MKKFYSLAIVFITVFLFSKANGQSYHNLSSGPFIQNWSNISLITANDNWSGVPGIIGYLGQDITTATGTDPQTLLTVSSVANDIDVIANQTTPNTVISGGVAEFEITNPTIAFQGSGTADAPHIIIYINTTGTNNIRVQYLLRDIDGSADNAVQPVALQYRIGNSGNFINLPAAFIADASSGPNLASLETAIDIVLPAICDNQPQVELRIITTNAVGNDEWIGIDNINISASGAPPVSTLSVAAGTNAAESSIAGTFTLNFNPATTASTDVNFTFTGSAGFGSDYTISFSAGTNNSTTSTGTLTVPAGTSSLTVTITPIDDATFETTESITLTLSSPTGGYSLGNAAASINLADNDSPPTVEVNAGTAAAEPSTNGTFNITLSNAAPAGGITVNYTLSGTATAGTDYSDPLNGNVTIAEGMTSAVVTINVTDDAVAEPMETIVITLNSATSPFTIATSIASIDLSDNDVAPLTPVSLTTGTYTQDFNSLSNTGTSSLLPMGWSFAESGSTANATYS